MPALDITCDRAHSYLRITSIRDRSLRDGEAREDVWWRGERGIIRSGASSEASHTGSILLAECRLSGHMRAGRIFELRRTGCAR